MRREEQASEEKETREKERRKGKRVGCRREGEKKCQRRRQEEKKRKEKVEERGERTRETETNQQDQQVIAFLLHSSQLGAQMRNELRITHVTTVTANGWIVVVSDDIVASILVHLCVMRVVMTTVNVIKLMLFVLRSIQFRNVCPSSLSLRNWLRLCLSF